MGILEKSLAWMAEKRNNLYEYYDKVVERTVFDKQIDLIDRLKHKPENFLTEANIVYLVPVDAANTGLPDASVDYNISNTVLEHIPKKDIEQILKEGRRILKDDRIAIHFIDLSDHFQHQDSSITKINFLRYSDENWEKIAGIQLAYCNRLRRVITLPYSRRLVLMCCAWKFCWIRMRWKA